MNINFKINYLAIILLVSILIARANTDWQYACDFNGGFITKEQANPGMRIYIIIYPFFFDFDGSVKKIRIINFNHSNRNELRKFSILIIA